MSKFGAELIESLTEAVAHAEGHAVPGMRVTAVERPDVKAIQRRPKEIMNAVAG